MPTLRMPPAAAHHQLVTIPTSGGGALHGAAIASHLSHPLHPANQVAVAPTPLTTPEAAGVPQHHPLGVHDMYASLGDRRLSTTSADYFRNQGNSLTASAAPFSDVRQLAQLPLDADPKGLPAVERPIGCTSSAWMFQLGC